MPLCCECAEERPRSSFSKLQLRKPADSRKCRSCVEGSAALIECSLCKTKREPTEFDKETLQESSKHVCGTCAAASAEENNDEDPRVQEIVDYLGDAFSNCPLLLENIKVFLKDLDEEGTTSIFKASRTNEEFKKRSMRCDDLVLQERGSLCTHQVAVGTASDAIAEAYKSLIDHLNATDHQADTIVIFFANHREVVNYDFLYFIYSMATENLARKKLNSARTNAKIALYLQMFLIKGTSALLGVLLPEEMFTSYPGFIKEFLTYACQIESDHGLVKFIAKRVPCKCLEEIKKEIKVSGQDICDNCRQEAPVKKLKECKQCHLGKYCSRDCQVAHWGIHKEICEKLAGKKKK